jgi:hypothetical protein
MRSFFECRLEGTLVMGKTRGPIAAAMGMFAGAVALLGGAKPVLAACGTDTVASNGDVSTCDGGDLCLDSNYPANYSAYAFPKNEITNYNSWCWTNLGGGFNMDNQVSTFGTKWTVSVTLFQHVNYNNGNPGGYACFQANAGTGFQMSAMVWAGPSGLPNMNDSLSSHASFGSTC